MAQYARYVGPNGIVHTGRLQHGKLQDVPGDPEILDLLNALVARDGMSLVFITHDLAVLSQVATHAVVLDEGRVIEHGPLSRLLTAPASPITQGLLRDATATL